MKVTSLRLTDYKAFARTDALELSGINLILGRNNAGKSTLVRSLLQLQQFAYVPPLGDDVRAGADAAMTDITLSDVGHHWGDRVPAKVAVNVRLMRDSQPVLTARTPEGTQTLKQLSGSEPDNFIVPFLGQRRVVSYSEDVRRQFALQVGPNLQYLPAKLTRIVDADFPGYPAYTETCKELVGHVVRPISSENGLRPGFYTDDAQSMPIYIDSMGDGVPQVVGLLADLVLARGKLFLIEEPENDLHPQALKRLLEMIQESSQANQFVITTHSHIVLRHLGAQADSSVFYVEGQRGARPPLSTIRPLISTAERVDALRELGYELYDFRLWDGWLILEEASAERIVRDHLIPWFAERLTRVRTVSAGGADRAKPLFDDFNRLFVFAHLEPQYFGRSWVILDGDAAGTGVTERLRERYSTWDSSHFRNWRRDSFERYYPERFKDEAEAALALSGEARKRAKLDLLNKVIAFCDSDSEAARREFEASAMEVIETLQELEAALFTHHDAN